MPGCGLPEGNQGLLPWTWAEQRLKKSHNYWITTVKPDGSPHSMVVWGLWQDGRILFSTGSKSRKARNLTHNANCVLCTEDAPKQSLSRAQPKLPMCPRGASSFAPMSASTSSTCRE
jgi:hypothetical protein